jgi:hypothetical protein
MTIMLEVTTPAYRKPAAGFSSYREFWPYYVAMHSKPLTRRLHLVGTLSGLLVALVGGLRGRPKALGAFPALGYGFAWPAHWFVEGNNPASFGHPLWSLRGDFEMTVFMLTRRDRELNAIAQNWLTNHAA